MDATSILVACLALALGASLGAMLSSNRLRRRIREIEAGRHQAESEGLALRRALSDRDQRIAGLGADLEKLRQTELDLNRDLATEREQTKHLREQLESQKTVLLDSFRNLSNEVVTDQSKRIIAEHRELLEPLRQRLVEFSTEVRTTREKDISQFESLKAQLESLRTTSEDMRLEARNLTQALKSDSKAQGNWGEVVLERMLERSGLTRDAEYTVQPSFQTPGGKRLQPDVVIRLPQDKQLIIDSKVSLTAFVRWSEATDDAVRAAALKDHLRSIRSHIDNLSAKSYDDLPDLHSPDFVMLFIPVEPAFHLAVRNDPELYDEAYDRKIVLVCPSTLLAMLKTVTSIWRREKQDRYALEIAELGGKIHDKLAGFDESMQNLNQRLDQARTAFEEARGRLLTGRGSVASYARRMVDLGAKARKELSPIEETEPGKLPDPTERTPVDRV